MEVDSELLEIFLDEAHEYLARLRDPATTARERADAAHGLKGAASMLGFERLRVLAIELERRIRAEDAEMEPPIVAAIAEGLRALAAGTPGAASAAGAESGADAAIAAGAESGADAAIAAGAESGADAAIAAGADAAELGFAPDEARMLRAFFVDEAREHLDAIVRALLLLAQDRSRTETLNELFRETHTLKGAAATVGLTTIAEHAHRLEDRFARLRDGRDTLDDAAIDAFLTEADGLREMVEQVGEEAAASEEAPPPDAARLADDEALDHIAKPIAQVPPDRREGDRRTGGRRRDEHYVLRVDATRIDALMDAVGELVFERTRIERRALELQGILRDLGESRQAVRGLAAALREDMPLEDAIVRLGEIDGELASAASGLELSTAGLLDDTGALQRTAATLQEGLTRVRVMPMRWLFSRLERPLREAARAEGKQVALLTRGEETELDKVVVEQITDPVIQLVRNAIAHGIEPPAERRRQGKPEQGTVTVEARHQGDFVYLEVADDGAGIDFARVRAHLAESGLAPADTVGEAALIEHLFAPGFSTRQLADQLAGRGVGLDVVRENISRLGGDIGVTSGPAQGTRFTIRLPLTTAITTAVLFKVGGQVYALPAAHVIESTYVDPAGLRAPVGLLPTRDGEVPLLALHPLLGGEPAAGQRRLPVLVLALGDRRFAVTCDKIVGPREIVVRSLGPLLAPLDLYAGATISGAGKVQLVLDINALAALLAGGRVIGRAPAMTPPQVLLCDDSRSIREAVSRILAAAGYAVQTAPDGWEAWELLQDQSFDLLVTDLEMPRLDGFDLIAKVRRDPELAELPILVLTSRTSAENRLRADRLGSDGFLTKPVNRRMFVDRVSHAIQKRRS